MSKLSIVGTPIGNLGDLSPRGVQTLEQADYIAAEDTRVTLKLLNHFGIKKPMVSYHEHNIQEKSQWIADRIQSGEHCDIVTYAGMPCISDPGEVLVHLCHQRGIPVEVVPGPSAVIAALAASGLATSRFAFEGFLTVNRTGRMEHLNLVREDTRTLIFYEAPHKLVTTLEDMLGVLGDRELVICRELTKLHEEIWPTTLSGALERYRQTPPRGEFVLVLSGAKPQEEPTVTFEQAVERALALMAGGEAATTAAKQIAKETGYKRGDLYKAAVRQMEESDQ